MTRYQLQRQLIPFLPFWVNVGEPTIIRIILEEQVKKLGRRGRIIRVHRL